jgi:hypothetical protein
VTCWHTSRPLACSDLWHATQHSAAQAPRLSVPEVRVAFAKPACAFCAYPPCSPPSPPHRCQGEYKNIVAGQYPGDAPQQHQQGAQAVEPLHFWLGANKVRASLGRCSFLHLCERQDCSCVMMRLCVSAEQAPTALI